MALSSFALLKTKELTSKTPFVASKSEIKTVLMDDPALAVFADFTLQAPYTTNEEIGLHTALQQMKLSRVKSLFVIDPNDRILGHISARDIQGTKPAQVAAQLAIRPSEVTVKMLMIPFDRMVTLNFNELSNARVGHIVRLLHELGVNYIFVVEPLANETEAMRGIFSISRISHQLGENVMGDLSSHTVAEMTQRL